MTDALCMKMQLFFSLGLSSISFIWCSVVLELKHTENIQHLCASLSEATQVSLSKLSQFSHSLLRKIFCAFVTLAVLLQTFPVLLHYF